MLIINQNELLQTRNRLIEEISSIDYEEFNRVINPNSWSIAQVCHHLFLSETAFTKAISYGLRKNEAITIKSKNFEHILDRTKKINAPDMVIPNMEPFEVKAIVDLLNQSRTNLVSLLSTVEDPTILVERSTKHPIFGDLPLNQWIDLIYLHEQRHIEQIKELKASN